MWSWNGDKAPAKPLVKAAKSSNLSALPHQTCSRSQLPFDYSSSYKVHPCPSLLRKPLIDWCENARKQCGVNSRSRGIHPQVEWPRSLIFQIGRESASTRTFDRCDDLVWRSSLWCSQVRLKNGDFSAWKSDDFCLIGSCYALVVPSSKTC